MTLRKLSVIAFCAFICTLTLSGLGYAVSEETQTVHDVDYGGLHIAIVAPVEANPGENITISVATSASDVQQIYVNDIELTFYGVVNDTTKVTLDQITHLKNVSLTSHNIEYTIPIPDDISPGLTFGEISCDWKALSASFEIPASGFTLTYIKNVELDQLQAEYTELNATYNTLLQNYTDLEAEYNDLTSNVNETDSAHSLMYVFIVTTVICVITIIVLLMRKPKSVWT